MKKNILVSVVAVLLIISGCKSKQLVIDAQAPLKSYVTKVLSVDDARSFDYFFLEAERHKVGGNLNKAVASLQKCLQYDPNSAVSYFELGNLLLAANEVEPALQNFRMAVKLNPENEWYQLFLATVYQQIQDNKSAILAYEGLVTSFPNKLEYIYRLATLYSQEKEYLKAIDKFDQIEKIHGMEESISLEKFKLYLQLDDSKSAINEVQLLAKENANQAKYLVLLGDAYIQIKEYKKSFKAYNQALKINPEYGQGHLSLAGYYEITGDTVASDVSLKRAFNSSDLEFNAKMPVLVQVMMKGTSNKNAVPMVEELVNILMENYSEEADLHYYYGNFLVSQGQNEEAKNQFEQVIDLDPSRYETWLQLAGFQMELENWDSVISITNDIIDSHPKRPEAFLYKGASGFTLKKYDLALDAFLEGLKFVGKNKQLEGQFLANIGDAYHFLKERDKAFEYYEKALVLDDHNIMVLNNYSYYLSVESEQLDKAERMSAKCVELEPGNSTYLDTYAWVLYKKKDYLLAKFYIEQAMDNMKDKNGVVVEHYGDILFRLGEKDKALELWKQALELGSDTDLLPQKIEFKNLIEE